MTGETFILVAEGAHKSASLANPIGWSANAASTSGTELPWLLPAGPNGWHHEYEKLTFAISIVGVAGTAPTAWSIAARFEQKLAHTIGYARQFPAWAPFDAYNLRGRIAEAAGWAAGSHPVPLDGSYGTIADQTDGLPTGLSQPLAGTPGMAALPTRVLVTRTVTHLGSGVRVALLPTITGGDSTTRIMGSVAVTGWRS